MLINNHPSQAYLAEITQDKNKSKPSDTRKNISNTQDSVSISEEGSALAKELYAKSTAQSTQYTEASKNVMDPMWQTPMFQKRKVHLA